MNEDPATPVERSNVRRTFAALQRFHPHAARSVVGVGVLSVVGGLLEAATLVIITAVAVSTTKDERTIELGPISAQARPLLGMAIGLMIASIALGAWLSHWIAAISATASLNARQELLEAFHEASYERKSQDRIAALQEALTTYVDRFAQAFAALCSLLAGVLNLAAFATAALVVNLWASLAMAAISVVLMAVLKPSTRRIVGATDQFIAARRAYAEGATESVLLAREQSVFGVTRQAGATLRDIDASVAVQFRRARFLTTFVPKLYQGLAFIMAIVGLFALTSIDVANLAAIGAVVLLLVRSLSFGQQVLQGTQILAEHASYLTPLVTMIDSYSHASHRTGTTHIGHLDRVELTDVGFSYPDGSVALQGVDLTIRSGEAIGLLGPSGSGKTTLVNILLRLYEPTAGAISVNGVPLAEADDDEWHQRTAIVPQEPRLFHGTVADNIRFLRNLGDEAVQASAEQANIASFVESLPDGYLAGVGELGNNLSGGQRQRICIARALAGGPDLLVLDEPTSALDGESEAAIQRTLEALKGKVTMVIVAHRLSTLSICDRLVVLQDGKVAAAGPAEELSASSPYFRDALKLAGL